jgi:hypothetical protein
MKNRWKYFKWTPRVARIGFMYAIFTPAVMAYVFYKTDVSSYSLIWGGGGGRRRERGAGRYKGVSGLG